MRCDARWARKGCAFWVSHRSYGEPGRCENRRDVRPMQHGGKFVIACSAHRAMVERGQGIYLASDIEAENKRQLKLMKKFKRVVTAE